MTGSPLLWLDLETTGTDEHAQIIEVACCVTEPDAPFERIDAAHFAALVEPTPPFVVGDEVLFMHTHNGLWAELEAVKALPVGEVEKLLLAWLGRTVKGSRVRLAGAGVEAFDRVVLERWMPSVSKRLLRTTFDFSAVRKWQQAIGQPIPVRESYHRAWPDVQAVLDAARRLAAPVPVAAPSATRYVCATCLSPVEHGTLTIVAPGRVAHYPACPDVASSSML